MMPRVKRIAPEEDGVLTACAALEAAIFPDPWSLQNIRSAVCAPCTRLYGAFSDTDALIGYVFLTQVLDTADIDNIAVAPDFRRQGIAALLLDTALDGVDADIHLEVRASNAPAIALYQKYGFTAYGTRRNYYDDPREDAVLMIKQRS
jgi:ribosomal-protein-alanine N-acetyltransferase